MMIASDLDRTLIYSKRAISELGGDARRVLKPVESKEGKWLSFMTESSFAALKKLCHQHLFVPVTTRTEAQFRRIAIFHEELSVTYAVTTNGAVILEHGEPISEWTERISSKLKLEAAAQGELLSILDMEGVDIQGERREVEHFFFYYLLKNPISMSDKKKIVELAAPLGWRVSIQGRKLYFIPKAVNKGDALQFICEKEGQPPAVGAGDSILDWDFLKHCSLRLVPLHGELVREADNSDFMITEKKGLLAAEEILEHCFNLEAG